ncbi:MAG: phenylacetate-CoA oxygenase subunit PaaJ [Planctomycetes bacterium]|nr:phenylacetate-CoA oxygenase subunit PaaJ [Planctomycetota bacterium]
MVTRDTILDVLRTIDDPEMPISIVDLGIVEDVRIAEADADPAEQVEIDILPTFIGCPALPMIEQDITQKVGLLDGVESVRVRFVFDPPWSVDRITPQGRKSLEEIGVTVPERAESPELVQINLPVACPFCKATNTRVTSPYGPTRCRMIYYCDACKNSFEHMKRV